MRFSVLAFLILLGGCRCASEPLLLRLGELGPGETRLPDMELNTDTTVVRYPLRVQSQVDRDVLLKARLGPGTSEGVELSLDENVVILREGREQMIVNLTLPRRAGEMAAEIVLESDDLPGWSVVYELRISKSDRPHEGRRLRFDPRGVDLGPMRAGDTRPFAFRIHASGTEAVTLENVEFGPESGIRIPDVGGDERIEPGSFLEVRGTFRCPEGDERQVVARVRIHSNAEDAPVRSFEIAATRARDFELQPPQLSLRTYPGQDRKFEVEIRASGGPFVVKKVAGLDPYFELEGELPTEPQASVKLGLRLREGAPTGAEPQAGVVRFEVEPPANVLEWPYRVTVLPSVHAQPDRVDFGTIDRSALATKSATADVQIIGLPGREFDVTSAASTTTHFVPILEKRRSLPPRIIIQLPAGSGPGIYRDEILVRTTDKDVPSILIKASAVVK